MYEKITSVLQVLQSKKFEPVVTAIKEKSPNRAEFCLREIECEQDAMAIARIITPYEYWILDQAIGECYKRIHRLNTEME